MASRNANRTALASRILGKFLPLCIADLRALAEQNDAALTVSGNMQDTQARLVFSGKALLDRQFGAPGRQASQPVSRLIHQLAHDRRG